MRLLVSGAMDAVSCRAERQLLDLGYDLLQLAYQVFHDGLVDCAVEFVRSQDPFESQPDLFAHLPHSA